MIKHIIDIIKSAYSSVFFKIALGLTAAAAVFTVVCIVCYNSRTAKENALSEEGLIMFENDLSDEYYADITSRFVNQNGESYQDYKMLEGIGISFFGDGGVITETSGGYTMPVLTALNFLERYVYIMGNEGETPETIAAKQGGAPMYARPFTIPAKAEKVRITLKNDYGTAIVPILENNGGLNPCSIGGVEGEISVEDGKVYFTRSEEGNEVRITSSTIVETRAMKNRYKDITIVFLQELPEGYSPEKYRDILVAMRNYQRLPTNSKSFYVIGPVLNCDSESAKELENILSETFGSYFVNAREYLCGDAIEEYKITIRDDEDKEANARGEVCGVYLTREGKLNIYGLYAISDLLTQRLNENDEELLKYRIEHSD